MRFNGLILYRGIYNIGLGLNLAMQSLRGRAMHKAISNSKIFMLIYLILLLPTYWGLADSGAIEPGSIFYILSMAAIFAICMIRGEMIAKKWLVLIPLVAFLLDLMPAFSAISFTTYLYHLLAMIIGVACPITATLNNRYEAT